MLTLFPATYERCELTSVKAICTNSEGVVNCSAWISVIAAAKES